MKIPKVNIVALGKKLVAAWNKLSPEQQKQIVDAIKKALEGLKK